MSIIHNNNLTKEKAIEMLKSQNVFQMTEALKWLVKNPDSYADVKICQHLGVLIADTSLNGASPTEEGAERIGFYLKLSNSFETSVKESIRKLEKKTETLTGRVAELTKNNELVKKNNIALSSQVSHFGKTNEQLQKQNAELSQVQQTLQETRESLAKAETLVLELRTTLADHNTHQIALFGENSRLRDVNTAIDKTVGEKTEENKLLSKELSEAKKATLHLSNQLKTAQGELTAQSSKVTVLEKHLKDALNSNTNLQENLNQKEKELESKQDELLSAYDGLLKAAKKDLDLSEQLKTAEDALEIQSSQVRTLEQEIKESKRTLESLKREKSMSEAEVKSTYDDLLGAREENSDLFYRLSTAQREVQTQSSKVRTLEGQIKESERTLESLKLEKNLSEAQVKQLETELAETQRHLTLEQGNFDRLTEFLGQVTTSEENLQNENNELTNKLDTKTKEVNLLSTQFADSKKALKSALESKKNLEATLSQRESDLNAEQAKTQALSSEIASKTAKLQKQIDKLQAELLLNKSTLEGKNDQEKVQSNNTIRRLEDTKANLETLVKRLRNDLRMLEESDKKTQEELELANTNLKEAQLKAQDNELHLVANNRDLSSQVTNQQAEIDRLRLETEEKNKEIAEQKKIINELMSKNAQQKTIIDQLNSVIGSLKGLVSSLWEFICWIKDQSWMSQEGRTAIEINQRQGNFSEAQTIAEELAQAKAEAEAKVKAEAEAQAKKAAKAERRQRKVARRVKYGKNQQKVKSEAQKNQEVVPLLSAEEKAEEKILKKILEAPAQNPVRSLDSVEIEPLDEIKLIPQTRREFHVEAQLKFDATVELLSEFEESLNLVAKKYDEKGFPNKFLEVQATVRSFRNELASINDKLQLFSIDSWDPLDAKDATFKEEFEELLSRVTQFTEIKLIPQTRAEFHAEAKLELDTIEERLSEFKESLDLVAKKYDENGLPNKFLGVQATVRSFQNKIASMNDKLQPFLINSREPLNAEDTRFKEEFDKFLSETTQYMSRNKPKIETAAKQLPKQQSMFSTFGSYFGWGKQA